MTNLKRLCRDHMGQSEKIKRVMIIAGEASGDLHGATLATAMLKKNSSISFFGIGGPALREAGIDIRIDASELTVMGITGVFSKLPAIFRGLAVAKKSLRQELPDLLILIDFADFNLRVAKTAKKLGVPVLYYIPPKVWAWRTGRVKKIKQFVDQVAVILPFEERFFKEKGIPAKYVGNPLIDYNPMPGDTYVKKTIDRPVIGFLPGSRYGEITKHLPIMTASARRIQDRFADAKFIISVAATIDRQYIETIIARQSDNIKFQFVTDNVNKIFEKALAVVAVSGTVTLEAAIAGIPTIIVYKTSPLNFWIAKTFIDVKHVGLASLIAGEEVAPELLQSDVTSENISEMVCRIIDTPEHLEKARKKLMNVRALMGEPGVSDRVADMAIEMLK